MGGKGTLCIRVCSSGSALQLLTQYPSAGSSVVESRLESVLWQESGKVHWWRRHISPIRGCQLTIHEELQAQYSIENYSACIDPCHRPSGIVCDMEAKF